jgi:purine-nucleoside phosphorylase
MEAYIEKVIETTRFLEKKIQHAPTVGLLTGTGLGEIAESLGTDVSIAYNEIPHFPISTVESHAGRLLFGAMSNRNIVAMQGRFHLYEGYSPRDVTFPIRVMQELGVRVLMLSNAAGGLNSRFSAGDIMMISDHINLTGENPLVGPNTDRWGLRFPEMITAYDPALSRLAQDAAVDLSIPLKTGVYAGLKGPSLESPAEVRFLKIIGADAVGFSTVQEVIAGVHAGIKILGLSVITNVHNPDNPDPATVEEILKIADAAAPKASAIIKGVLDRLDEDICSQPGISCLQNRPA